jgi:hypothetical protein
MSKINNGSNSIEEIHWQLKLYNIIISSYRNLKKSTI